VLHALKIHIIGVQKLVVKVNCCSIKGMLENPDLAPNASMNCWIIAIRMFHFELVHVPGILHGLDGLSCCPLQLDDLPDEGDEEEFEDWIDQVYGFIQQINPHPAVYTMCSHVQHTSFVHAEPEGTHAAILFDALTGTTYSDIPHLAKALLEEDWLQAVHAWLAQHTCPPDLDDKQYQAFMRYANSFFFYQDVLWQRDEQGAHQQVLDPDRHWEALMAVHDHTHHKGFYATCALLQERLRWLHLANNVSWFVKTCHLCQICQTCQVLIPLTVAVPAPLFAKMYIDTMHIPLSSSFKHIVQGRCSISHYPEARILQQETSRTLGNWLYEDILCRWGALIEIVLDNGAAFVKVLNYFEHKFHVKHIRISGYNSCMNSIVEHSHFDLQEALFKAADGDQSRWSSIFLSVIWANCVTTWQ